jgi:hypothetical protein
MSEPRRPALRILAAAAILAVAPRAAAADPEGASRQLFHEGDALAAAGRWPDACPYFQAAHELHATGGTALRAADCYERTGKDARAVELYAYILDHRATDKEPERVKLAEERLAVLKQKLDPEQPAPAAPAPASTPSAPPPPPSSPPSRVPMIVAFTVAGAGLLTGAVAGGLALSQAGDVKTLCNMKPACTGPNASEAQRASDGATTKAWIANVGFGVAIAEVVTGVVLIVTAGSPKAKAGVHAALQPEGVTLRF